MRKIFLSTFGALLLLLPSCLGGTGTPGAGPPASSSFSDSAAGGDASRFLSPSSGAAADSPPGPVTPNGDSEGIHMTTMPPRVRYGSDLSQTLDQNTSPSPTLDLAPANQLDLAFVVETQEFLADSKRLLWSTSHPSMKVCFILTPDGFGASNPRSECAVHFDPPTEGNLHQLSLTAASGMFSLYYDLDAEGGLDCKQDCKQGLVKINDEQYNAATTFALPLGAFNLRIPPSNPDSTSNQIRLPF